jgi:effector-binding domain-containing protein
MVEQNMVLVGEKDVDEVLVAGLRWKGRYSDVGGAFQRLAKLAGRHIRGKPMNLYYDADYKEADADMETCYPVHSKMKPGKGIELHRLPGGQCVYLVHKGPYDLLSRSYAKVMDYVQTKKYRALTPSREIYLKGPGMIFRGNPENYLTEIQIMISEK